MSANHVVPTAVYYRVFATLLVLTGLTVWVAFQDLGAANTVVAMTIAVIKATLVVLYFMHVRYGSRLTWVFVVAGVFWLAVLITLTLSDELTRGWLGVPGR
jgi:cytochrome c oxidase subunit 4